MQIQLEKWNRKRERLENVELHPRTDSGGLPSGTSADVGNDKGCGTGRGCGRFNCQYVAHAALLLFRDLCNAPHKLVQEAATSL